MTEYSITGMGNLGTAALASLDRLRMDAVQAHTRRLVAITEEWCIKAASKGPGHRLWRSEPVQGDTVETMFTTTYRFVIVPPGNTAPGRGWVYGPFGDHYHGPWRPTDAA